MNTPRKIFSFFVFLLMLIYQIASPAAVYAAGISVNTFADEDTANASCSLREAIIAANTDAAYNGCGAGAGGDTISFSVSGTITLGSSLPDISTNLTIDGGGLITIDGANSFRILNVTGGSFNLNNIILARGNSGSENGGALYGRNGSSVSVSNSTFFSNTNAATNFPNGGGAIFNEGTMTIAGSTFNQNSAAAVDGDGGAIESYGAGSSLTIINTTFTGNVAGVGPDFLASVGGAINIRDSGGVNTLTYLTVSNNTNQNLYGAIDIVNSAATLRNSILANSVGGAPDCSLRGTGTVTGISNLIETQVTDNSVGVTPCDPTAITPDPALGSLQNNGGPTETMALGALSPALNVATCVGAIAVDQRGVTRPQNGGCDIGAYERDSTAPTVTINQAGGQPDPTNISPINFTVVFSEAVSGFVGSDVTLTGTATGGGTTATVTGSGTTYNVAVGGLVGDGTVTASIAGGVATDIAGNSNTASTSTDNTVTYDTAGPTVTINQAIGQADPANSLPINFTVVFSEPVANFVAADVTLSGVPGATATVTGSGTTYNVAVDGLSTSGTVTATIAAGVASDAAGNTNAGATSTDNSVTYDNSTLTVTINQAAGQLDPTNISPINFTVVFSAAVSDFATGDVTLSGTATGIGTTAIVTGSGTTYNVAISGMTGDGTVIATIAAGVATNSAGTGNQLSTSTDHTVTYATNGSAVTINQATGQSDPTAASPINFTVVFAAPVTGFTTGDVTLSGTAGATTQVVTEIAPNDGTTYNVAVSGMTVTGSVIATVPAGVAQDSLSTGNLASTSTDNTVTYDLGYPTVSGSDPANNETLTKAPTQLTVRFSKDVKSDGSATAANNTANYLLVERGANNTFNTVSCSGGLVADDTQITINSATYSNNGGSGPFVATLNINSGTRLPVGHYRLFVCGTTSIEDLAGNTLNNGLSDATITFSVILRVTAGLPKTGFPMNKVTALPAQPIDQAYASTDLWLEIPKLNVKMSVVGVPFKDGGWDVKWLDKNAGWLNGSAFPTWNGNSVLTGHVWDALNQPGPFAGLKDLKYGDQVKVHAFGQVYTYQIRESILVSPTNTAAMLRHEDTPWITLITCEDYQQTSGTYSYRRLVRAVLVDMALEK